MDEHEWKAVRDRANRLAVWLEQLPDVDTHEVATTMRIIEEIASRMLLAGPADTVHQDRLFLLITKQLFACEKLFRGLGYSGGVEEG